MVIPLALLSNHDGSSSGVSVPGVTSLLATRRTVSSVGFGVRMLFQGCSSQLFLRVGELGQPGFGARQRERMRRVFNDYVA